MSGGNYTEVKATLKEDVGANGRGFSSSDAMQISKSRYNNLSLSVTLIYIRLIKNLALCIASSRAQLFVMLLVIFLGHFVSFKRKILEFRKNTKQDCRHVSGVLAIEPRLGPFERTASVSGRSTTSVSNRSTASVSSRSTASLGWFPTTVKTRRRRTWRTASFFWRRRRRRRRWRRHLYESTDRHFR